MTDQNKLPTEEEKRIKAIKDFHVFLLGLNWIFLFSLVYLGFKKFNPYIVIPYSAPIWFIIKFTRKYVSDQLDALKSETEAKEVESLRKRLSFDDINIKHLVIVSLMMLIPGAIWYGVGRGISALIS